MDKKLLKQLKERLEKEKEAVKKELQSFAKEDKKLKGDWDARFPRFGEETGGARLEKAADEVEEYEALLFRTMVKMNEIIREVNELTERMDDCKIFEESV